MADARPIADARAASHWVLFTPVHWSRSSIMAKVFPAGGIASGKDRISVPYHENFKSGGSWIESSAHSIPALAELSYIHYPPKQEVNDGTTI